MNRMIEPVAYPLTARIESYRIEIMSGTRDQVRILHVDDKPDFAELTVIHLEREDGRFTVETATGAERALERLDEGGFDCIVSDYDMPGTNGIELLEAVREEYPDLPFILFTGKGSEEIASEAISRGVTDYLQKQPGSDQYTILANRIDNAVSARQSATEADWTRQRLEQILKTVPACVVQLNRDGEFIFANERAVRVLGLERSDVTDRAYNDPEWAIRDLDGNPIPDEELPFRRVRDSGEPLYGFRHTIEWPDGTRKTLLVNGAPLFGDDGAVQSVVFSLSDITENRVRQEQLRETTARLQALFEHSPVMINVHDAEGNIIDPNPPLCEETGYDEAELTGMKVWDLDQSIDPDEARGVWEEMAIGERRELEGLFQRRDGSTFPVEIHIRRLDLEGEVRFVVISRNISERKARERELERYEAIVENTEDGIYVFDADGNFEFVNQRVVDVSGISRDTWVGEHVSIHTDLGTLTEGEVVAIEEGIEAIVRGDADEVSVELTPEVPGDPGVLELRLTSFRTESGVDRVIGFSRDITDRERRERTLRELQRRTETLIRASTREEIADVAVATVHDVLGLPLSGVHLVNDARDVLEPTAVTDEVREHLGYAPAYDRTAPERSTDTLNWEIFEAGETVVIEDTHDHDWIPASETPSRSGIIQPLGDHGLFITSSPDPHAFDDTDVALMEILATIVTAALDRTEREVTLRDRTRRLEAQKDRLDEFAGIVSHDLRNPLNVAEGRLELAQTECDSEHLDPVERALERMRTLIDDLLTLAQEGAPVDEMEAVRLADVTEACWGSVETTDATLVIDTDGTIRADRSRLQQLLENLMRNAVEHGGADVTVRIGESTDREEFYVADDGPGIPEEERETVFESGYSTSEGGTGFGLAIVKEIAQAHGWEISVTDSEEGGARFEVTGVTFVDGYRR